MLFRSLDTSISMINRGKIRVAARNNQKIPEGVALDKFGKPTTDAKKALEGVQLPIAVFYMATGFHGFHVIVGTIFLAVCLWRGKLGHFNKDHHFGFEAAAWYWHFVDVVWLFLFAAIYIWGS